jgi:hypothetical protein
MSALSLFAGPSALARIRQEGLSPEMFSAFLGASGGPKWFVLYGLDKVIFSEFLHKSDQHIDIIGSSAGAFRASCFAQNDPSAAIDRLAERYSSTVYSEKPTVREITQKGIELLNYMMGDTGVSEVLKSKQKTVHISVAKCHGLVASEHKLTQLAGLTLAAARNAIGRAKLQKVFTRVLFSSSQQVLGFSEQVPFKTEHVALSEQNFLPSLMASGSIPAVIEGVEDISGAPPGMYRDGGIIDYHFDMKINTPQLVIYPHFYKTPIPGWFDKVLKRPCHASSYDNALMLVPSDEFVANLPFGKIPDRKDFESMPAQDRIKYWRTVMQESERLGDEFLELVEQGDIAHKIQAISLRR